MSRIEGPRGTREEEFKKVMKLIDSVFRGEGFPSPSKQELYSILLNRDNLENMRIILVDGEPVAHLGIHEGELVIYGHRMKVGSIGSVCTHPDHRGRGYATALLRDAIRKLNEDGVDVMLVSGDRGLYRRAGCAPASKMYAFSIGKAELEQFRDPGIELVPYREEHIKRMIEIYEREPVRFHRKLEEFRRMLISGSDRNVGAETFVVLQRGELLGYLSVQPPVEPGVSYLVEYAGSRWAAVGAMGYIFDIYGIDELRLVVPFHDREMIHLLRIRGLEGVPVEMPGYTVKVINFVGLMERLRPYMEERLGRIARLLGFRCEGERYLIRLGREELAVEGDADLVRLIFGSAEGSGMIPETGELKVLADLFPIPLVYPGLNYV
ncbi:hypothetical protein DRP77_12145 [Candidatus Poribacteria bacterium]|mgnify:CR=1 FL=1|nr:MAG: hypothetical protein DRP77_12145 [Candidatus Poribacteria bacterium]